MKSFSTLEVAASVAGLKYIDQQETLIGYLRFRLLLKLYNYLHFIGGCYEAEPPNLKLETCPK